MKHVFVSFVMICSLLLAIYGCSNDLTFKQVKDLESPEKPGIDQEETDNNNPDSQDEQEPNEPDQQDIDQEETDNNDPDSQDEQEPKVPLSTNDQILKIEINELRTVFSSSAKRVEYIEFKVKSAGNLGGLQLYIMWDAKNPYIYNFPAVNVKLGEYVTLHLRTLESTCVDELGEDLSASAGTDSCPTARDLWVPGSKEWLHETDIVYLQDANGKIIDAIIMNKTPNETWEKNREHLAGIAEDLYNKGAWKSADGKPPSPLDAVNTSAIGSAATKSISRYENKENTHTAKDWYITDLGGASPGQPNK